MQLQISPAPLTGAVKAIASKSYMHRALICASLADKPTVLHCPESNRDIRATAGCLSALGAEIREENGAYYVTPMGGNVLTGADLFCDESGSTLRFLIPVACALGSDAVFHVRGRLSQRPLSPMYEELVSHGAVLSENGVFPMTCGGRLESGDYSLDGSVSSQFFTGLLLALNLPSGNSRIAVKGRLESSPYVSLTASVMEAFGVSPRISHTLMEISPAPYRSPGELWVEGDWSNAAFWLTAGVLGGGIAVTGLQAGSAQGDKAIVSLLREMGGNIREENGVYITEKSALHGITVCAEDIPDLVPILSVAAACAEGETVIKGASRLRLKESDRIASVCGMLRDLGCLCRETEDGMVICGGGLAGGNVDACNDHRIAMSAAVASVACSKPVVISGAEAVDKSYPAFFEHFRALGGIIAEL